MARLVRRLGWGDDRKRRMVLYQRLCELHESHPREMEEILSIAWADSLGAKISRERLCIKIILDRVAKAGLRPGRDCDEVDAF